MYKDFEKLKQAQEKAIAFLIQRDGLDSCIENIKEKTELLIQCSDCKNCHGSYRDYRSKYLGTIYANIQFLESKISTGYFTIESYHRLDHFITDEFDICNVFNTMINDKIPTRDILDLVNTAKYEYDTSKTLISKKSRT